MANQVGWAVGPFLSGLVQARYGFAPLFVTTCLLYAASTGLTWLFFHKKSALARADASSDELSATDALETLRG